MSAWLAIGVVYCAIAICFAIIARLPEDPPRRLRPPRNPCRRKRGF